MTTTTPATLPTTGTWDIDAVHSYASFKVTHHVVASFRSGFHGITGALEDGVLSGSVPVQSIELRGSDRFAEHLLGPNWFDAEAHPEISFKSTSLDVDGDGGVHGTGELTIKGVTKTVELGGSAHGPAVITRGNGDASERFGLDLKTTVDRRDFGLEAGGGADSIVKLNVALELINY